MIPILGRQDDYFKFHTSLGYGGVKCTVSEDVYMDSRSSSKTNYNP